jgi:hypothetical protein
LPFLFSRITEAIEDLLRIVKVAMPEDLFENDPRVIKAESVRGGSGNLDNGISGFSA